MCFRSEIGRKKSDQGGIERSEFYRFLLRRYTEKKSDQGGIESTATPPPLMPNSQT